MINKLLKELRVPIKYLFLLFSVMSFNKMFAQKLIPMDAGSKVHFVIKNFAIKTGGDFTGLKGNIFFDDNNIVASNFNITVEAASVDTDNGTRDGHLKKPEYFDVNKYPTVHLVSIKIEKIDKPATYLFNGNLTIKNITKPVRFLFTASKLNGGNLFVGNFEINRRDFNIGGSSFSLSDDVKIAISVFAK